LHRALSLRGWTDSVVLVDAPTATPALAKHRAKMLLKAAAEEGADEAVKEEAEAAAADARFLTACLNLPLVGGRLCGRVWVWVCMVGFV
jgi:hypothetical protein